MESVWSASKLSTESVGSRRELHVVAKCVHTDDADATKQFRRVGVGGVYWAYERKDGLTKTIQRDSHQSVNAEQVTGNAKVVSTSRHSTSPPAARQYVRYVVALTGPCSTCSSVTSLPDSQPPPPSTPPPPT